MPRLTCAVVAAFALVAALPAQAESTGTARCALIGPLVMSGYIGFMREVAGQRAGEASAAAARLESLISLHDRLGCDGAALNGAIECVTRRLLDGASLPPAELAEACMRAAKLPLR